MLCSASLAALLAVGAPAIAHIDPDPTEAQAGATLTVSFTVEHGCDGSPTVQLDMRLPEGVTNAEPEPLDGWEGSVDADVITFVGGPLADDVEQAFAVSMTLPPTPDTTIFFPFVQRCEEGEIRWIGIPDEPGEELDEPAPAMLLTGPVATPTDPAVVPTPTGSPGTGSQGTSSPGTSSPETVPSDDVTSATIAASEITEPTLIASNSADNTDDSDDSGDSDTGTFFFVVTVLVVLALGVFVWFRARSARSSRDNPDAG